MLGDLLKAIELLINAISRNKSPDHKREQLAKELVAIHQNLDIIVDRGYAIIELLAKDTGLAHRISVQLLSEQIGALEEVGNALDTGAIATVLQLHQPSLAKKLKAFMRIPMMSISQTDLMPIRSERSDARLSQCEIVIGISQEFYLFSFS